VIALLRLLATGQPVPAAHFAATVGQPETAITQVLEGWPGV